MSEPRHRVRVDNGKYEFISRNDVVLDINRHGEPWVFDMKAPNAVAAMMAELDAARVVLQAVRELERDHPTVLDFDRKNLVRCALARHDGLVDDREAPSPWAVPAHH